jgi:hypothetical protein
MTPRSFGRIAIVNRGEKIVFAGEVNKRTAADRRLADLETGIAEAVKNGATADAARLRAALATVRPAMRSEKLGQVADEFDARHSIERARGTGSVHKIVTADGLRPYLIDAIHRGMQHMLNTTGGQR